MFPKLNISILLSMFVLIFSISTANAQICNGSLGDPVVNIDFGSGPSNTGPSLGSATTYRYTTTSPDDGWYTIAKSTFGMNGGWYNLTNHTPDNGYMMVVNANPDPGVFYESASPIDLCPNTTYEFASWVVNMLNKAGKQPNITFIILSMDNKILGSYNTGDIPNQNPIWKKYGFSFTTTNASQVKIRIVNNGPGGDGNDLALDDITFRACGPQITAGIGNSGSTVENICEKTDAVFNLTANVEGSATLQYQWQQNVGQGWVDMPATGTSLPLEFVNAKPGVYSYRLTAAEPGNFSSVNCRTASPTLTINVNKYPEPEALSNSPVCLGDPIILDVSNSTGTYEWRDPAGNIISTEKSPVIDNATYAMSGKYTVKVNSLGCEASSDVLINIVAPPVASVENSSAQICEGSSVVLAASGGSSYKWSPAEGLSATNIANPIASPLQTTLYTVEVSNGGCSETAQVNVIVNKAPVANAGPDKKILLGYSKKLEGKASGDDMDYFWTPSAGLDDPHSLTPTASPDQNTTYTLHVTSGLGCTTAVDDVFVKVYEKVIIPSAFSPNGDSINDVWNITAIDVFESPSIKVMNRYGMLVFESTGHDNPWDGKYKNHDLPAGVYYYLIKLSSEFEPLSGPLTIIR